MKSENRRDPPGLWMYWDPVGVLGASIIRGPPHIAFVSWMDIAESRDVNVLLRGLMRRKKRLVNALAYLTNASESGLQIRYLLDIYTLG